VNIQAIPDKNMNHLIASRLILVMPVTSLGSVTAFHSPSTAKKNRCISMG